MFIHLPKKLAELLITLLKMTSHAWGTHGLTHSVDFILYLELIVNFCKDLVIFNICVAI